MLLKSDLIRDQRHCRGWTQEQLAELCDISVRTVQRLEKTGMASMETTNALAAVLEIERVTLLADRAAPVVADRGPSRVSWRFGPAVLAAVAVITFALGLIIGRAV